MVEMSTHQIKAAGKLRNRGILRGDVGSGKSRAALLYHILDCGGQVRVNGRGEDNKPSSPRPLYIITTAKKRDDLEWERELALFGMTTGDDGGWNAAPIVIDSWNNIAKYATVRDATFLFDEQRLVGSGAWVKAFYQIARKNRWVILTATPGDDWQDYIPVFVANKFYRNKTEMLRMHAVYNKYAPYPKVDRWVDEATLERFRDRVLVEVDYKSLNKRHILTEPTEFDMEKFDTIKENRWNPYENRPIQDVGELFRLMRRVSNEDNSRISRLEKIFESSPRLIIFYNFDYELEKLRHFAKGTGAPYAEWNGHHHMAVPSEDSWVYLVQYTAGSEGWNCTSTDSIAFYSLTYSWKAFEQSMGRIDRLNTPYNELYYYVLRNQSWIDQHIWASLMRKKNFNERAHAKKLGITDADFKETE